jgi:hypothetical protein
MRDCLIDTHRSFDDGTRLAHQDVRCSLDRG